MTDEKKVNIPNIGIWKTRPNCYSLDHYKVVFKTNSDDHGILFQPNECTITDTLLMPNLPNKLQQMSLNLNKNVDKIIEDARKEMIREGLMEGTSSDDDVKNVVGPSAPPPRTPGKSLIRPKKEVNAKPATFPLKINMSPRESVSAAFGPLIAEGKNFYDTPQRPAVEDDEKKTQISNEVSKLVNYHEKEIDARTPAPIKKTVNRKLVEFLNESSNDGSIMDVDESPTTQHSSNNLFPATSSEELSITSAKTTDMTMNNQLMPDGKPLPINSEFSKQLAAMTEKQQVEDDTNKEYFDEEPVKKELARPGRKLHRKSGIAGFKNKQLEKYNRRSISSFTQAYSLAKGVIEEANEDDEYVTISNEEQPKKIENSSAYKPAVKSLTKKLKSKTTKSKPKTASKIKKQPKAPSFGSKVDRGLTPAKPKMRKCMTPASQNHPRSKLSQLNRSTANSRVRNTKPMATPAKKTPLKKYPNQEKIVKNFVQRNTPEKASKKTNDVEEKKRLLALKGQQEEERRIKIEEEKLMKIDEAKRNREERFKRINQNREINEAKRAQELKQRNDKEKEKQARIEQKKKEENEKRRLMSEKTERSKRKMELVRKENKRRKVESSDNLDQIKKEERQKKLALKKEKVRLEKEKRLAARNKAKEEQVKIENERKAEERRLRMEEAERIRMKRILEEKRQEEERIRKEKEMLRQEEKRRLEAERAKIKKEMEEKERVRQLEEKQQNIQRESAADATFDITSQPMEMKTPKANSKPIATSTPGIMDATYDMDTTNNYNMTATGADKIFLPSTENDYNIQDLASDDETDDEDAPKKQIPKWAQGLRLKQALRKQFASSHSDQYDLNHLFPNAIARAENLDLGQIFNQDLPKYKKRTSSACWDTPIKPGHVSFQLPNNDDDSY